ncbi:MAG: SIS domain-containing protein [bacterium]|nr:SIS domain-containing protein [bacterium]
MIRERIIDHLTASGRLKMDCAKQLPGAIEEAFNLLWDALAGGGKILLCGNGGSAADAQHIAGELVGRFSRKRPAAAALALTTDTSVLTAVGNDYGFDEIFARQVEALGRPGDSLMGISTSGRSRNVELAMETARRMGLSTVGLLGMGGGDLKRLSDAAVIVPSESTPRIQEAHITIGHIWCDLLDERLAAQASGEQTTPEGGEAA